MSKKDETIVQLERILSELKAGKEESATTAVIGRRQKSFLSGTVFKLFFKFLGVRVIIALLILALLVAGGFWLYSGSTFKKETSIFVENVQELATLATAKAHINVIIEQEDNKLFGKDIKWNIPGTKREVLLVIPATVTAGVNLQNVTSKDIKVDEKAKELEIILPPAEYLHEPAIIMDQVKTFSDEGLFRGEMKWLEGFDLAAEAQGQIEKEATELGVLQTAETNTENALNKFFGNLGYTVNVSFK